MSIFARFKKEKVNFNTVEGIRAIPIPEHRETQSHNVQDGMEYILQRKAMEHKHNDRMDLAIECLRKSNELMPYSFFEYSRKDYERLIRYLREAQRFDKARVEEEQLDKLFGKSTLIEGREEKYSIQFLKLAEELDTDLVEMTTHHPTCEICSMYQGRVFSISGNTKPFPLLPNIVKETGTLHPGCRHSFYPYIQGSASSNGVEDIITFSCRPFIDDRTDEEKVEWERIKENSLQEQKDRKDYAWIQEHLPNIAPKSFGAYRRMKNSNSEKFKQLIQEMYDSE